MLKSIVKSTLLAAACGALAGCFPVFTVATVSTTATSSSSVVSPGGTGGSGGTAPIQVTAIAPTSDTTAGGAAVTITGSGFTGTNSVVISPAGAASPTAAASIISVNDTQLVFRAPAFGAGLADIDIHRTDGTTARLVQSFLYTSTAPPPPTNPAPALSSISPTSGAGGTVVTITGTGFTPGATITIGAEPADLVSLTATTAVVLARPGAGGAQDVTLTNPDTQSATLTGAFTRNGAPVVTINLPADARAMPGDQLTFTVSATDPEGDPLSLRLVNPPVGAFMAPVSGSGTQQATVRWHVRPESAGTEALVFQAQDWQSGRNTGSATALVQVAPGRTATLVGDVTGDGVPDIVSGSYRAGNARGAVYIWDGAAGTSGAPTATCAAATATAGDLLGSTTGQGIFLRDITGDGTDDLIVLAPGADVNGTTDAGAVYVWVGGPLLAGTPAPSAVLTVPGAMAGDRLGDAHGRAIRFGDVTGDGTIDLIVAAQHADRGGQTDAGALYVWSGGVQIVLNTTPLATLDAGTPLAGDKLAGAPGGNTAQTHDGFLLAEVTGDGVVDIIATGAAQGGSVYVWHGHPAMNGNMAPLAIGRVWTSTVSTTLATGTGQGLVCRDVTGDGINDLVVLAEDSDVNGSADAGQIFVWAGGSTLVNQPAPVAACRATAPAANDRLGRAVGAGLRCLDVTGDGVADILAAAQGADIAGVSDAGAIYMWNGGIAMTGNRTPGATLYAATRSAGDQLGNAAGLGWQLADCTGDGLLDVVAGSRLADTAVTDAGRICVWAGGSPLWGTPAPTATCEVTGATQDDQLGSAGGRGIVIADVDGDRIMDIVAGTPAAANATGVVYGWFGGGNLSGTVGPVALFTDAGASAGDRLSSGGLWAIDLDGDGQAEVVAAAPLADLSGNADAGAVAVWKYTVGTAGTISAVAMAQRGTPAAGDKLGGESVRFGDCNGDGTLDLAVLAADIDHSGLTDAGRLLCFSGQALLGGTATPLAELSAASPATLDRLGATAALPLIVADLDGDGTADALVTAPLSNAGGTTDAGALHRILGGATLGAATTLQELAPAGATGDKLGE